MEDLEKLIDEIFNQPAFNDDINDYPPEDIFITPEINNESVQKKPYEHFIPTITFHFDKPLHEINYDELQALLGEDAVILNVGSFPTTVQVGLLSIEDFKTTDFQQLEDFQKVVQMKINSPLGQSVGNLVDEPTIHIPSQNEIKRLFSSPTINDIDTEKLRQIVLQRLRADKNNYNLRHLFTYEELFNQMERQIQSDFIKNPYELVIVKQTLLPTHFMHEYDKLKKQIPEEELQECFLYHGSRLNIHQRIQNDAGVLGKGIYASDNPFYVSVFGNGGQILENNETTQIICCRVIYNKTKVHDLNDKSFLGKPIDNDITNNFGCNHALVGDSNGFLPISPHEIQECKIAANEFVFPNKFQIIPLCSLTVMRRDYYILWKDPVSIRDEGIKLVKEVSKNIDVNFYTKTDVNDALRLIKNKKYARVKLITNAGPNLEGKEFILQARAITQSNFVCLVFCYSISHIEWVSKMENVLFTRTINDFKIFVELEMNLKSFLKFISHLQREYEESGFKFQINQRELLNFPRIGEVFLEDEDEEKPSCNIA